MGVYKLSGAGGFKTSRASFFSMLAGTPNILMDYLVVAGGAGGG